MNPPHHYSANCIILGFHMQAGLGRELYLTGASYRDGRNATPLNRIKDVSLNRRTAGEYFLKAAEAGNALGIAWIALLSKGTITGYLEDQELYLKWSEELGREGRMEGIIALARCGDLDAMYSLGVLYEEGIGVRLNYKDSVEWYRK